MKKEKKSNKIKQFKTSIRVTGEVIHSPCTRITKHKKSVLYHFPKKVILAKFKKVDDEWFIYRSEYCPELNSLISNGSLLTINYYSQLEGRVCLSITYDKKGKNYFAKKRSQLKTDKRAEVATGDSWDEFIYNLTGLELLNGETCFTEEVN